MSIAVFASRALGPIAWFAAAAALALAAGPARAETLEIGIGTQHTTTNTVMGGIVLKELGLLDKHLPKTGKYKDIKYTYTWQNATSAPPLTNAMMAGNIQIATMGDYPVIFNGSTGQATKNPTQLVAITSYNAHGGGNGIVVHKDSPYYELADLKGKKVSVPFGSAAHGMMLRSLQDRGLPSDFWNLVSQSPEIGTTNLQEKRIDAHGDFVPFAELLPYRGFGKIYDGVETKHPTFHGVVVRKDFAEKYPEIVVGYIKAMMEANEWFRKNPQAAVTKIEEWTKIEKEVVYIFLGPGGVHTIDPTIKPKWVEALKYNHGVLTKLNLAKELDFAAWVNDSYVRQAFKELGLDYEAQLGSFAKAAIEGQDPVCKTAVTKATTEPGQIWIEEGEIVPFSSTACTLAGVNKYTAEGKKLGAVYLIDRTLGIKLFADAAFFAIGGKDPKKPEVVPFLLKRDAEAHAQKIGGKVVTYAQALAAVPGDVR